MKQQNKAVGVITAILATLLSIFFVLIVFATAVFGSATSIVQPANIVNVVQNIDYAEAIGISADEPFVMGDVEIPVDIVNQFMESPAVEEILSTYTESVSALLTGKEIPEGLTPDKLRQIADRHLDDLLDMVADYLPEDMPKQELRDQVYTLIDENAEEILAELPTPQQLAEEVISTEDLAVAQLVLGPTVITVMVAACVVLALLIVVCRLRRFGWMLWVGIDSLVVAALLSVTAAGVGVVLPMVKDSAGEAGVVVESVFGVVTSQLWLAVAILAVVGIAGIVACCIIRKNATKKALLAATLEVAPAEQAQVLEPVAEPETVATEAQEETVTQDVAE